MKLKELPPEQIKIYIKKNWDKLHRSGQLGKAWRIYYRARGMGKRSDVKYVTWDGERGVNQREDKIIGDPYAFAIKTFDGEVPTLFDTV